ncbi:hypothetical protein DOE51_14375 [Bdellovibrio sp. NC01]|nr:hypothetical protein DOE51_14375 [Bdellovibrio sp. NC01]
MLLSLLFLSACGSRGTFLDDFLVLSGSSMGQIDQYFDLDEKQHQRLEKDIDNDLNRLRKERFKEIAQTLRKIEKKAESSDPKIMSSAYRDLQAHYKDASSYFTTSTNTLISSLKPEQIANFEKQVRQEIKDTKEALNHPDSLNEEIIGRYKKGLEFWIGDLSLSQNQDIAKFAKEHPFPWKEKIKNKEAILAKFIDSKSSEQKMKAFAEKFVTNYDSVRTPEYAKAIASYENEVQDFLDSFWKTLSPDQKSRMKDYLLTRADKLESLAKK